MLDDICIAKELHIPQKAVKVEQHKSTTSLLPLKPIPYSIGQVFDSKVLISVACDLTKEV
jgi:hypothetical protein